VLLVPPQPLPATCGDPKVEGMNGFGRLEAESGAGRPCFDGFDQALAP
jgi:hypothetical protein